MNQPNCPICKSTQCEFSFKKDSFSLYICGGCGVRFSYPMQHPGQTWYEESEIYEEVEWNVPSVSKLGQRWEFSLAMNEMKPRQGSVFDVGCGRGDFLKLAQSEGHDVNGIDLNPNLVRVGKDVYGLTTIEYSTFEAFCKKRSGDHFDYVTAFEVLEHLPDPHEFIRNCRVILSNRGKLIISVPGFNRWPQWVNSDVDLPPHHLVLWTEGGLRELLRAHGFENITIRRKPLLLNDLMYHAVRVIPGLQAPGIVRKLARGVLKVSLVIPLALLRLHPKAGAFTLIAVGDK